MSPPPQPGQQFQPSSGFGQQLVAQVNATGYGQLPGQTQPQSPGYPAQYQNSYQTGYPQQQQAQSQYNTGYPAQQQQYNTGLQSGYGQQQMQPQPPAYQDVAQFDPYGPIAQGWGENPNQSQNKSQPSSSTYNGNPHPREFIRTHKAELEIWDPYAWKQVLNAFDELKDAWAARKKDVEGRIAQVQRDYGYTGQQEVARLYGVLKDAESKFGRFAVYICLTSSNLSSHQALWQPLRFKCTRFTMDIDNPATLQVNGEYGKLRMQLCQTSPIGLRRDFETGSEGIIILAQSRGGVGVSSQGRLLFCNHILQQVSHNVVQQYTYCTIKPSVLPRLCPANKSILILNYQSS